MMRGLAMLGFVVVVTAGCGSSVAGGEGGSGGTSGTTSTTSDSTTSTTSTDTCPSYAGTVAAIVQTYCVSCHGPGGQEWDNPLDTYAALSAMAGKATGEVSTGKMPPMYATSLPASDEEALLAWLSCGAPDN